jgi:hypothetical protein
MFERFASDARLVVVTYHLSDGRKVPCIVDTRSTALDAERDRPNVNPIEFICVRTFVVLTILRVVTMSCQDR